MRIISMRICLVFIFISVFSSHLNAGARGYRIIFVDFSDGLGVRSLFRYENFLKENSSQFDDRNINCWKKRAGTGFDSIKKMV